MTGFHVETDSLPDLHDQVERVKEDAEAGRDFVSRYADIDFMAYEYSNGMLQPVPGGEGLLQELAGPHDHAYSVVHGALDNLASVTSGAAGAIADCQKLYESTDQATAESFDKECPGVDDPEALRALLAPPPGEAAKPPFTDISDPGGYFDRFPAAADGAVEFAFDPKADLMSPSAYIRWVIVEIAGFDPFERVLQWFSGDWSAYTTCAVVWDRVDKACPELGANLVKAAQDTTDVWQGNAAEGCQSHLVDVGAAIADFQSSCLSLVEQYQEATQAAKDLYEACTGILGELVDLAIFAALGPSTAVLAASRVVELIGDLNSLYGRSKTVVMGIAGIIGAVSWTEIDKLELPDPPQ